MKRVISAFLLNLMLAFSLPCFAVPPIPYPYPVAYFEFQSQNQIIKMAYMDVKPQQPNGKTVLLLHGKLYNGRYWEGVIPFLTSKGYRVIVPDQIGFGLSSQPDHYQFTFQDLAKNTNELLNYLHISKPIIIAHSMGGMLATRYALMYPDQVSSLILENPIGLEDWKLYIPYHSVDELFQQELKQTPKSIREFQKKEQFHGVWKPEYDRWINTDLLTRSDFQKIAWNQALLSDMIFTQPVLYEFQNLRVPTLLIIGQLDKTAIAKNWAPAEIRDKLGNYPKLGKQTASRIPHAQLIPIANAGHIPHVEQPQAFYQAVSTFLK